MSRLSIFSDTATLPEYEPVQEDRRGSSTSLEASSSAPDGLHSELYKNPFIGGSGVRVALTKAEKEREDIANITQLSNYGVQTWISGQFRYSWDPMRSYQEAVSQLDALLPHISPTLNPLKTITLRLPGLPPADHGYFHLREGRDEIGRALKGWLSRPAATSKVIWVLADVLTRRLRADGFTIVEEWWDFNGDLVQFVVRC